MVEAALWAGGATVIYLCMLWLVRMLGRAISRRMLLLASRTVGQIRVGGTEILHRGRAIRIVRRLLQAGFWAIVLLLTYEWLGFVLGRFPYTRAMERAAQRIPRRHDGGRPRGGGEGDSGSADRRRDLLRRTRHHRCPARFLRRRAIGAACDVGWLDADSARPTRRLADIAVWIFALAMAYPYIPGSDTEAFKGLSVLLGLMVSLGASGIVGQAASGLILMYTRTFRPGEYVRVGDHEGTIVEMGMFTTRLRTGLGEELTLPNSLVLGTRDQELFADRQGPGLRRSIPR